MNHNSSSTSTSVSRSRSANGRRRRNGRRAVVSLSTLQGIGNNIIPQRKVVIVSTQWTGYLIAGNLSAAGNFASILPNSLYQPFNPATGNTVTAATFGGTSSGGASVTSTPIGYTYLSTNWQTYKVLDYEVELTINPQNSGDTCAMAIAPLGDQEQPTTGTWNFYKMSAQRYALSGRATNGANTRLNSLKYSGPFHRDIGLTKRQWLDFPQTPMGTFPTGNDSVAYFGIFLSTLDGATNANPLVVDIVLRQRVVVSDPVQYGN